MSTKIQRPNATGHKEFECYGDNRSLSFENTTGICPLNLPFLGSIQMDTDVFCTGVIIISETPEKWDADFQDFFMVIISGKNWLEGTLRKAPFK